MNENNDNVFKPKATGPIIAAIVLILVIALVVVLVSVIAIAGASGSDEADKTTTTTIKAPDDPDAGTTTTTPADSGDDPVTDPGDGDDKPDNQTVPTVGVDTDNIYKGNLLQIDSANYYRFDKELLLPRTEMAKLSASKLLDTYNFTNIHGKSGGNYIVKTNNGYFLDVDALAAFNKMMAAYVESSGNKDVQIRNAYYYDANDAVCLNATGMVLDLEINKNGGTYPLNYVRYKTEYYDWFVDNCGQYGFIHVRDEANYSSFRYVGAPHAAYMALNDYDLETYISAIKGYRFENRLIVNDSGTEWWIYYVPGSGAQTQIPVPSSAYSISGNNIDGFIVALNASELANG